MIAECEASLRRLQVDCIDLYQMHWPQPDEDIEEGFGAMADAVKAGKVLYADFLRGYGKLVIIDHGGGFMSLALDHEGYRVAYALADRGITAFVLKYRLNPTPADAREAQRSYEANLKLFDQARQIGQHLCHGFELARVGGPVVCRCGQGPHHAGDGAAAQGHPHQAAWRKRLRAEVVQRGPQTAVLGCLDDHPDAVLGRVGRVHACR